VSRQRPRTTEPDDVVAIIRGVVDGAIGRPQGAARLMFHPPPRSTRYDPVNGPVGFETWPAEYAPYQSATHSQTLPAMS
jgi:hypothetical protein